MVCGRFRELELRIHQFIRQGNCTLNDEQDCFHKALVLDLAEAADPPIPLVCLSAL